MDVVGGCEEEFKIFEALLLWSSQWATNRVQGQNLIQIPLNVLCVVL